MLITFTGPSGVGKTTIIDLLAKNERYKKIISSTTRPMRKDEIDGESYYFLTKECWHKHEWILSTVYDDNFYGFNRDLLLRKDCFFLLNLDENGVKELKNLTDDVFSFLITVSDRKTIIDRLNNRLEPAFSSRYLENIDYQKNLYDMILYNDDGINQIVDKIEKCLQFCKK